MAPMFGFGLQCFGLIWNQGTLLNNHWTSGPLPACQFFVRIFRIIYVYGSYVASDAAGRLYFEVMIPLANMHDKSEADSNA